MNNSGIAIMIATGIAAFTLAFYKFFEECGCCGRSKYSVTEGPNRSGVA